MVITASGVGHLVAGGIGFLGLIVASHLHPQVCTGRRCDLGRLLAVIGVYYLVAFAGIAREPAIP